MFNTIIQAFLDSSTLAVFVFIMYVSIFLPFAFLFLLALRWIISLLRT